MPPSKVETSWNVQVYSFYFAFIVTTSVSPANCSPLAGLHTVPSGFIFIHSFPAQRFFLIQLKITVPMANRRRNLIGQSEYVTRRGHMALTCDLNPHSVWYNLLEAGHASSNRLWVFVQGLGHPRSSHPV